MPKFWIEHCPVCREHHPEATAYSDSKRLHCPRCGTYEIVGSAEAILSQLKGEAFTKTKVLLSGWIQDRNAAGEQPAVVTSAVLTSLQNAKKPRVTERSERLLRYVSSCTVELDSEIDIEAPPLVAVTYSGSTDEVLYLVNACVESGWLKARLHMSGGDVQLTPQGHNHIEKLAGSFGVGDQFFVAMWFNAETNDAYTLGFAPAIGDAGYRAFRIDHHEHANKIDDEIVAQIRKSKALIADFTGHRGGVYFEAGFALGLGIPVI